MLLQVEILGIRGQLRSGDKKLEHYRKMILEEQLNSRVNRGIAKCWNRYWASIEIAVGKLRYCYIEDIGLHHF